MLHHFGREVASNDLNRTAFLISTKPLPYLNNDAIALNETPDPDIPFLLGIGMGLRWQPIDDFILRIDYGIPLIDSGDEGNTWQENGFYISINVQPF